MDASQLGSLLPFIAGQARTRDLPLSFLDPSFQDAASWKPQARERVLSLLHYRPDPCDPRAEVVDRVECDGYTHETVHFNTTDALRVPASVLIPTGLTARAPAIVALHDHGGFYLWGREKLIETADEHPVLSGFKRYYAGRSIASDLARQGYVVIVIDMFYWGERRYLLGDDAADWTTRSGLSSERIDEFNARAGASEQLVARSIYTAGFTWSGVMFWDDLRTVDYLITRTEVDPERIGCVGLSVGGYRSLHLVALDDRIKAAVVVGWMASFPSQLAHHMPHSIGFTKLVPGLYQHMDLPDVAAMAMPAHLLVINGDQDGLFAIDGVRACFHQLAASYRKAGIPERFRGSLYAAPHEFNAAMQAEAWSWFADHL
ncbi:MAG: dienelactone hydrolase family protein [Planctomycetes bacterium]|nr:dienelactone hydrolase family protein [Planctomycetota bacterium]